MIFVKKLEFRYTLEMIVISDTSPIVFFAKLEKLTLLKDKSFEEIKIQNTKL